MIKKSLLVALSLCGLAIAPVNAQTNKNPDQTPIKEQSAMKGSNTDNAKPAKKKWG